MPTRKGEPWGGVHLEVGGLQWGRVVADAEGRVHGDRPVPGVRASMGPRRCRRGRRNAASTASRVRGRFNGAASLPTRKDAGASPAASLVAGFNGAASLPTRKEAGPPQWVQALGTLQWGRVVADAEGLTALGLSAVGGKASMGPRRCRRGRAYDHHDGLGPTPQPLQWGRVVADAEGSSPVRSRSRSTSASMGPRRCRRGRVPSSTSTATAPRRFNGAASLPTRKALGYDEVDEVTGRFNGAASLPTRKGATRCPARRPGSRFNGAASLPTRKGRESRREHAAQRRFNGAASLPTRKGPRSCATRSGSSSLQWGRVVADAEGPYARGWSSQTMPQLQWGRVVADAEGGLCDTLHPEAIRRFNGAASLPTRKGGRRQRTRQPCGLASMGPRRCRRGRWGALEPLRFFADASMGPRRCRRGRSTSAASR